MIITDHHAPELVNGKPQFPPALAVVHTTQLCGTTVAWMVAKAVEPASAERSLDLCGLATIADQVPLVDANRSFAYHGLVALRKTERVGLVELCKIAGLVLKDVSVSAVNFGLVPRINAMGRLESGLEALRLLVTKKTATAAKSVATLVNTNVRRQELTDTLLKHALLESTAWVNEKIIIVHSTEYHEGVIGLIAGRLAEIFYKPAIVIAVGETRAKASARSIDGVNIIELIRLVKTDLLEVGGHPMAAGFGLLTEKLELVKSKLQAHAQETIIADLLVPALKVECLLPPSLIQKELSVMLARFQPFGQKNPEPVFGLSHVEILEIAPMGRDRQHVKIIVGTTPKQSTLTCIAWNKSRWCQEFPVGSVVDIAGVVEVNEWKGRETLQLKMRDIKLMRPDHDLVS